MTFDEWMNRRYKAEWDRPMSYHDVEEAWEAGYAQAKEEEAEHARENDRSN